MTAEEIDSRLAAMRRYNGEGGVEIMKASAGSGKTYSLAREYIRLLLTADEINAHRHILAVTFTNKATDEMKSRIIAELAILANDPKQSDYFGEFSAFSSEKELKVKAATALRAILDDYSAFSVCTIDKFFQRALRAFSREIGHIGEYQVELDREMLVSESVDRLLDSVSDAGNEELRRMLTTFSKEKMDEGSGFNLNMDLQEFAKSYMSSSHSEKVKRFGIDEEKAFSDNNLSRLKELCDTVCIDFDNRFMSSARAARDSVSGIEDSLNKNFLNCLDKFAAYSKGSEEKIKFSLKSWTEAVEDVSKAFKKNKENFGRIPEIARCVNEIAVLSDLWYKRRNTAITLRKKICFLRIASKIKEQYESLLAEKNVLGLDDTNTILSDLISDTATPFVYEKLGVRYRHFLLDEFQDTSTVQWQNFLPLLKESVASGGYNLIVGDVKQSIYRWRAADWKILDSDVQARFNERAVTHPLQSNFRSARGIIEFNNLFFGIVPRKLDDALVAEPSDRSIADIYSDVRQEPGKDKGVYGSVELTFCDREAICNRVVDAVNEAHNERNFAYKDIAVLVRDKKTGGMLAAMLSTGGIPVISNDALLIESCETVRRLVARLSVIDDPKDPINAFYAGEDFQPSSIEGCDSLTETVEMILATIPEEQVVRDTTYIMAFMDLLHDFTQRSGNSLHAFLRYWNEEGKSKSISSPSGGNAVTITTIHKSKGLDYPFVIIPAPKKSNISSCSWESLPQNDDTFGKLVPALYLVDMKRDLQDTLFSDNYAKEVKMRHIDDINTWYVAMTRASEAVHIVAEKPGKNLSWDEFDYGGALYLFITREYPDRFTRDTTSADERYLFGKISQKTEEKPKQKEETAPASIHLEYRTLADDSKAMPRISTNAVEFFSAPDGDLYASSQRVRGIVLHKIMEKVFSPDDLHSSVENAVHNGLLTPEEAVEAEGMLSKAISAVSDRGWFTDDHGRILEERDIASGGLLGKDRQVVRPDRVILKDGSVDIVDYKFAEPKSSHVRQVSEYVNLYRKMGYTNVRGYIWYVLTGNIEEIGDNLF